MSRFNASMRTLQRYSLVSRLTGSPITYNIHREVKRHLLSHLDDAQLGQALDDLTRKLRNEFPRKTPWEDEANNKKWVHSDYISHIVAINKEFWRVSTLTSIPDVLAQNFLDGAFDLWVKGLLEEGIQLINSARSLSSSNEFDDILTAEIISFQGTLSAESGEIEAAHTYFEDALTILQKRNKQIRALGQEPTFFDEIYLANAYNNLAGVLQAEGNYPEAGIKIEVAIFLKEKWREPQRKEGRSLSHLLCLSYQNLATTLARLGEYEQATEMFEKALKEGQGEVSAARQGLTYHNFGWMKFEQGLIEEACALLKSACLKREESLENHPDTAVSQHMLALCYQKRSQGSKMENLNISRYVYSCRGFITDCTP
jgi:tetratricopeptide (TPR) repeat protein